MGEQLSTAELELRLALLKADRDGLLAYAKRTAELHAPLLRLLSVLRAKHPDACPGCDAAFWGAHAVDCCVHALLAIEGAQ